jgi:hypothetical protein
MSASLALADDFKTYNGKEYKNAIVTQVDADGIVVRTKTSITKLYFTELPEDVRKRFNYDPEKAAAAQRAALQQTQEINRQAREWDKQQKQQQRQQAEQQGKQQNIQALANTYQDLLQQEEALLVEIGRVQNAQEIARRKYINGFYTSDSHLTDGSEASLPLLEGRLQNLRDEKERVRKELDRAQHESR